MFVRSVWAMLATAPIGHRSVIPRRGGPRWARFMFFVRLWRPASRAEIGCAAFRRKFYLPVARTVQSVALLNGWAGGS